MARGALAGFVLGAAIAAAFLLVRARRTEAVIPGPAAAAPAAGEDGRLAAEISEARSAGETLRKENDELKAREAAAATPSAKPGGSGWKSVAAHLIKLRSHLHESDFLNSPDGQKIEMEVLAVLGAIVKKNKMTLEEACLTPEGIPALLKELLEASDPPPDAAQQAKLEEILRGADDEWKAIQAKSDSETRLERARDLLALGQGVQDRMGETLSPEQKGLVADFSRIAEPRIPARSAWVYGAQSELAGLMAQRWVSDLKLDKSQAAALTPLAGEYVEAIQAKRDEIARREQNGEEVSWAQQRREEMDVMIATQRKLADQVTMTEKQAKAFHEWAVIYEVQVSEPAK